MNLTQQRAEFLIDELIGWAVRGAEIPGRIVEWREIQRLVSVGMATEQSTPCMHTINELGHCTRCGARPNDKPQGAPRDSQSIKGSL